VAWVVTQRKLLCPRKMGCFPVCNVRRRKGEGGPAKTALSKPLQQQGVGRIPSRVISCFHVKIKG